MSTSIYTADNREIKLPVGTDPVDIGVLTTDLRNLTQSVNLVMGAGGLTTSKTSEIPVAARNKIWRGKNLGAITQAQLDNISDGSFKDMYLGDYWTFNVSYKKNRYLTDSGATAMPTEASSTTTTGSVTATIVGFDYYKGLSGNATCPHHVVVILGEFFRAAMHNPVGTTTTIEKAYMGTTMYTNTLPAIQDALVAGTTLLNGHINTDKVWNYLPNSNKSDSTTMSYPTSSEVVKTSIFLPTEENICGYPVRTESPRHYYSVDQAQFPALAYGSGRVSSSATNRYYGWLRDMHSTSSFADASYAGGVGAGGVAYVFDVRPAICIC